MSNSPALSRSQVLAAILPHVRKHLRKLCSREVPCASASLTLLCPWVNHRRYLMCLLKFTGGVGGVGG